VALPEKKGGLEKQQFPLQRNTQHHIKGNPRSWEGKNKGREKREKERERKCELPGFRLGTLLTNQNNKRKNVRTPELGTCGLGVDPNVKSRTVSKDQIPRGEAEED